MTNTTNLLPRPSFFTITSSQGVALGTYPGPTEADALDALARDAGYVEAAGPFSGSLEPTWAVSTRIGAKDGYEVIRGARVPSGDGEDLDGVLFVGWRPGARALAEEAARRAGLRVDWASADESALPSWDSNVMEAPVCGALADMAAARARFEAALEEIG